MTSANVEITTETAGKWKPCFKAGPCPCQDPCARVVEQTRSANVLMAGLRRYQREEKKKLAKLPRTADGWIFGDTAQPGQQPRKLSKRVKSLLSGPPPKIGDISNDGDVEIVRLSRLAKIFFRNWETLLPIVDDGASLPFHPPQEWKKRCSEFEAASDAAIQAVTKITSTSIAGLKIKSALFTDIGEKVSHASEKMLLKSVMDDITTLANKDRNASSG